MEKILELSGVTKSFGKKTVVNDLSFDIAPGEICGFLGPNGSGKTTTIKMIVGLLSHDKGEIKICGHSVDKEFEQALENVGAIVENPDMYKEFSGRMNIALAARIHNVPVEKQNEIIKMVGMESRIDEKVKKYSLGMKQRVGIAIALLSSPKFLIFDEPTNGLDPSGIKDFRDTVKRIAHETGAGVLVSSHMMSEMELLCDKVVIIEKGKLLGVSSLDEIRRGVVFDDSASYKIIVSGGEGSAELITQEFGCTVERCEKVKLKDNTLYELEFKVNTRNIPEIIKLLVTNDIEVWGVHPVEESLEDVYMSTTGGGGIS